MITYVRGLCYRKYYSRYGVRGLCGEVDTNFSMADTDMSEVPKDKNRMIHSLSVARQVPSLLQGLFATELITPSSCLWLVSPWVSNIPILDNTANAFRHVEPNWPRGKVRLAAVLTKLIEEGTTVHVATRPERRGAWVESTNAFLQVLSESVGYEAERLVVHREREEHLHQKGLLGDHFYLRGSMNFTHNGIQVNNEQVEFTRSEDAIARARHEFKERWGGSA